MPKNSKTIKASVLDRNRHGTEILAPVELGGRQEQARNSVLGSFNPIKTDFSCKRRTEPRTYTPHTQRTTSKLRTKIYQQNRHRNKTVGTGKNRAENKLKNQQIRHFTGLSITQNKLTQIKPVPDTARTNREQESIRSYPDEEQKPSLFLPSEPVPGGTPEQTEYPPLPDLGPRNLFCRKITGIA